MNDITKVLSSFIRKIKGSGIKIIVLIGAAGIALIFLSGLFGKKEQEKTESLNPELCGSYDSYCTDMENKLRSTLERIDGVGKSEVMITVGGTEEYIYAEEQKKRTGENDSSEESEYVLIGSGGDKQALLKKILTPEITGAVIVCEGGDSSSVKEKIYSTVSAVFGISSDKIYVTKLG